MRPVISVSLNGRAYQLEDDAHAALATYLDSAARALAGNPDQAEILADLEQAIADKCERSLGPHKTVVARTEIEQVIREMGPVDAGAGTGGQHNAAPADAEARNGGASGATAGAAGQTGAAASKRLYQISDGALISGVCKGIAVYLDVDVTLVRVVFAVAAVLTGGLAVLAYIIMMFIVPYANTLEEHAAARGLPFNARVLVEQAKLKAAQLADAAAHAAMQNSHAARAEWKAQWRRQRTQWRQEWRRSRAEWRAYRWTGVPPGPASTAPPAAPMPPVAHLVSSLIWVALGLTAALATLVWLLALFSLVTTGAVFGWIPFHLPLWAAVIGLLLIYQAVIWPLRIVRHALVPRFYGYLSPWHGFSDALVGLFLFVIAVWYLAHHGQDLRHSLDTLQQNARPAWNQFVSAWQTLMHGAH